MKRLNFAAGFLCGALLFGGGTALAAGVAAEPSRQPIYVDGQQVQMSAYSIGGNNYVKLRDIGQAVGFNVYWQDGVRVDSGAAYTGEAPAAEAPLSLSPASLPDTEADALRRQITEQTNALRQSSGAAPLETDPLLTRAAQVRAEEMAAAVVYSHTRPDGRAASTVTDSGATGENIHRLSDAYLTSRGLNAAEGAMEAWSASAAHRANLLDSRYGSFGVGLAQGVNAAGEPCWYCVQVFLLAGHTVTRVDGPAA